MKSFGNKVLYIVISQLRVGGAERVASILLRLLDQTGKYKLVVESDFEGGVFYQLPDNIIKVQRKINNLRKNPFGKFMHLMKMINTRRDFIKQYGADVVISFMPFEFFVSKIATLGMHKKHIASDHTSMGRDMGHFINFLRHHFYNKADYVTILTQKDARIVEKQLSNIVVVPNPLTYKPLPHDVFTSREKIILCVGRVNQWEIKGFDRIIHIWASIAQKYSDWKLCIAGEVSTETEKYLKSLAPNLSERQLLFLGQCSDMETLYRRASIFALPSRVEGFPMVLVEAMSQGCACVAYSLDGAIDEIIDDKKDGLIIPDNDIEGFKQAMESLIENQSESRSLSTRAKVNIMRFNCDAFLKKWLAMIEN